jgi:hypothetical protein
MASLRDLEKLRVVEGDDMSPSISPDENLLLEKGAKPELGDVVLFENRFGKRIAHRLLHRFGGYCFTKGDNCPRFDFPFREGRLLGVIAGKRMDIEKKLVASILLDVFLPQFIIHSRIFGLKNKKFFLLLSMASKHYPYIEVKKDG